MFEYLQIYNRRERMAVGLADALLKGYSAAARLVPRARAHGSPRRILLLRLERIGDLLMTLGAFQTLRERAPHAEIHLVVGSWNEPIARLIPGITSIEVLDAPWLSRDGDRVSTPSMFARARVWRSHHFDLAINFEPDIRSNVLLALSGAPRRLGFGTGGGGDLLTECEPYRPEAHTRTNAERLVDRALPPDPQLGTGNVAYPRLHVPEAARDAARRAIGSLGTRGRLVGMHVSGGRRVKQWHPERFAAVAERLVKQYGVTIVFTGSDDDRPLVERVVSLLPAETPMRNLAGSVDLPVLAAVLERLDLFVTGDTGPMHLAAAVGTPTIALFGPSDPARYGPLTDRAKVVTADLWCRPCNRVRRPPSRCTVGVPDCLDGIDTETVVRLAAETLHASS